MNILLITKFIPFLKQMDGICLVDFVDSTEKINPKKIYDVLITDLYSIEVIENLRKYAKKIWVYCSMEELEKVVALPIDDFILRPSTSQLITNKLKLLESQNKVSSDLGCTGRDSIEKFTSHLITRIAFNNKDPSQERTIRSLVNFWHLAQNASDYALYQQLASGVLSSSILKKGYEKKELREILIPILAQVPKSIEIDDDYLIIRPKLDEVLVACFGLNVVQGLNHSKIHLKPL